MLRGRDKQINEKEKEEKLYFFSNFQRSGPNYFLLTQSNT